MTLWAMDPAARDAKLAYKALRKKGGDRHAWVLIEVACASSPDHLVAVRKAYCSAYDSSLEEDVAACPLYKDPLKQARPCRSWHSPSFLSPPWVNFLLLPVS